MHEIILYKPPGASGFYTWIACYTVADIVSPWTICTGPNYASSVTIRMYIFSLVYLCLLITEQGNSIKLSVVLQECCKMPLKYFCL